ncbi:hypothetical protein ABZ820_33400 [Streptomyces diacarni]|uniref:hypothetical protein n=1 Tax=Streptomyces diacarni TaxID=2800381 RepID=UPI0033CB57BA
MSIQPVTARVQASIDAVYEAFEAAYLQQQKGNQYPLTLTTQQETQLIAATAPHLGNVPAPAKITELLSEIQDLHRLDGRCLEFEGEEYEPGDDGYGYALSDHEDTHRAFIKYLIHQQMK